MEAPLWTIILNPWLDEPVFHRYGYYIGHVGKTREFTQCGREVSTGKPWLPFKHTVKFGRPCKGCFPEGIEGPR